MLTGSDDLIRIRMVERDGNPGEKKKAIVMIRSNGKPKIPLGTAPVGRQRLNRSLMGSSSCYRASKLV